MPGVPFWDPHHVKGYSCFFVAVGDACFWKLTSGSRVNFGTSELTHGYVLRF